MEKARILLWKLQTVLFINSKQCFSFTIRVIKNSNIVLSAISCWSDNGTESTEEVNWRYQPSTIHRAAGDRRQGSERKLCFCIPVPLPTSDNTQNRRTLRFNSLSKKLLFVPLCFFASVVFIYPSFHISPFLWRPQRRSQTSALSQSALFDDLHYILFVWRYSGLTCHVCINCSVNDSNKRKKQSYGDGNESAHHCRGHVASRELSVV